MYKAPPPRCPPSSSTRPTSRGFARGFSIQTISPLPIGWAEHVTAEGHWGRALREYMRDYNHWTTIGVLNELLPLPDNRVTLADETDPYGMPVAHVRLHAVRQRQAQHGVLRRRDQATCSTPPAPRTCSPIQRYAHLIGGARMGTRPDNSVVDAEHRVWGVDEPVSRRRLRVPDAGLGQPGADDHGAGVAAGRAAGDREGRHRPAPVPSAPRPRRAPVADRMLDVEATFPPRVLREYALLADGERGALIGPQGEVAWMCAPRWDSDAVFSTLIGGGGLYASPRPTCGTCGADTTSRKP